MVWWQIILFPLAIVYNLVTRFRNHLYDIDYKTSFQFDANVISVGNLSVGGTGKSPMVEFLIRHFLNEEKKVTTLSRGYGRKTKGFRLATAEDTPKTIGDEPFNFFKNFGSKINVTVGEDRVLAVPSILYEQPDNDVILLDDAFQHRPIQPSFNILLTPYQRPFYKDYLLPSGLLRESRKGASRADVIVVTKCPEIDIEERKQIIESIQEYSDSPIFFTNIDYHTPESFGGSFEKEIKDVVVVSGIAKADLFHSYCQANYNVVGEFKFKDHHDYSRKDINVIIRKVQESGAVLMTTEKDAGKIKKFKQIQEIPSFYVPISIKFLEGENQFLELVNSSLESYVREEVEDL